MTSDWRPYGLGAIGPKTCRCGARARYPGRAHWWYRFVASGQPGRPTESACATCADALVPAVEAG